MSSAYVKKFIYIINEKRIYQIKQILFKAHGAQFTVCWSGAYLNWHIHFSCYDIIHIWALIVAINVNDHFKIGFNRWITSKYMKLKYLSILPFLPITLLTCRSDYLGFTGNKPCRTCCMYANNLYEDNQERNL